MEKPIRDGVALAHETRGQVARRFSWSTAGPVTTHTTSWPMPGWPLAGVQRIKELCPQVMVGQTVGAGHLHQLLVPDQVNPMIDRCLAISVSGDA